MSGDEAELIRRAKEGDPAAFAEIYARLQPAVYRYVYYRVGDAATAEDLTGEVFVRLVEKIERFTPRGRPLMAWLYTIARNLVVDFYRQVGQSPSVPLDQQPVADTVDLEEAVARRLSQQRLVAALAHLTEEQRQVVLLKFIEGLDNETVARMLGRSVNAVKALQHRALAGLRRILEQDER